MIEFVISDKVELKVGDFGMVEDVIDFNSIDTKPKKKNASC